MQFKLALIAASGKGLHFQWQVVSKQRLNKTQESTTHSFMEMRNQKSQKK